MGVFTFQNAHVTFLFITVIPIWYPPVVMVIFKKKVTIHWFLCHVMPLAMGITGIRVHLRLVQTLIPIRAMASGIITLHKMSYTWKRPCCCE